MKTTMRTLVVVIVGPGSEGEVALLRVRPMSGVSPLTQSGLNEAFSFAVGLGRVRTSATVSETHLITGAAKQVGTIAAAVVGEQGADGNAVASEELNRVF